MRGCLSGKRWKADAVNGKAGCGALGVVVIWVLLWVVIAQGSWFGEDIAHVIM